jgi:hypothetical protein
LRGLPLLDHSQSLLALPRFISLAARLAVVAVLLAEAVLE